MSVGNALQFLVVKSRALLRSRSANVAMMFGLAMVPLTLGAGAGLDVTRGMMARSAMSKALNAAAVAVGNSPDMTEVQAQSIARRFFDANYHGDPADSSNPVVQVRLVDHQTVTLSATQQVNTPLLAMAGIPQLTISVHYTNRVASKAPGADANQFDAPQMVTIQGYDSDAMEPFISRDGATLFFNNLNAAPQNTDIHYATKTDTLTFQYKGKVGGVNTTALEGVPSMDRDGNFHFVSPRAYAPNMSTLFGGKYSNGSVTNVALLQGDVSQHKIYWFNMDSEISADGQTLYFSDNHIPVSGTMDVSRLEVAHKTGEGVFTRDPNSDAIMQNVNSGSQLTYGAGISEDELTLYFTRTGSTQDIPAIYVATRSSKTDPFGTPQHIDAIDGFVEAPTVAPGGCGIYFHKKVSGVFRLFYAHKTGCD